MNPFGHIDMRVSDLEAALPFYEALLPALRFTERYHGDEWKVWATTDPLPSTAYVGITESLRHRPNEKRIAFWVASADDVDGIAEIAREAGQPISAARPGLLRRVLRRPRWKPAGGLRPSSLAAIA